LLLVLLQFSGATAWLGLDRLDRWLYDTQLRLSLSTEVDARIVIVDIDPASLAQIGPWPWPRHELARLSHELLDRQAVAVLGFDMVFPEPENRHGLPMLRQLAAGPLQDWPVFRSELDTLSTRLDGDAQFAQALRQRPVVLGLSFHAQRDWPSPGRLPSPLMPAQRAAEIPVWSGFTGNTPLLADAAPQAGYFNVLRDADGRVRAMPWLAEFQGAYYPAFPLAVYLQWLEGLGQSPLQTEVALRVAAGRFLPASYTALEAVLVRQGEQTQALPVDNRAASWIPFKGRGGPAGGGFRYVSALDVLQGRLPAQALAGQLVLVGTSAPVLHDLHPSPVGTAYPGVQMHASVLAGMLDGHIAHTPDYAQGFELGMLLLNSALMLGLWRRLSWPRARALGLALLALNMGLHALLVVQQQMVLPLASSLLLLASLLLIRYGAEVWRPARWARQRQGCWAGAVSSQALHSPTAWLSPPHAGPELTVLVVQIAVEAALVQGDKRPCAAIQTQLQALWYAVTQTIWQHHGCVVQHHGTQLVAVWGAPLVCAEPALQAVRAAVQVGQACAKLQQQGGRLTVGMGIETGPLCFGPWAADEQGLTQGLMLAGPAAVLARQLADAAPTTGLPVLVGSKTRAFAPRWLWQAVEVWPWPDAAWLTQPNPPAHRLAYAPRWIGPDADLAQQSSLREELSLWRQCLKAYQVQDWDTCELMLGNLQRLFPAPLYTLYGQRLQAQRQAVATQISTGLPVR
jgi:adenylate cyclase